MESRRAVSAALPWHAWMGPLGGEIQLAGAILRPVDLGPGRLSWLGARANPSKKCKNGFSGRGGPNSPGVHGFLHPKGAAWVSGPGLACDQEPPSRAIKAPLMLTKLAYDGFAGKQPG